MAQYISKSALVAEIERLKEQDYPCDTFEESTGYYNALDEIATFINTLEVKEVDLEKETDKWYNNEASKEFENVLYEDIEKCAKHFFELGLRASNPLTWEDMRELHIIFESIDVDIELSRTDIEKETLGYYESVLKRFKA